MDHLKGPQVLRVKLAFKLSERGCGVYFTRLGILPRLLHLMNENRLLGYRPILVQVRDVLALDALVLLECALLMRLAVWSRDLMASDIVFLVSIRGLLVDQRVLPTKVAKLWRCLLSRFVGYIGYAD